MYIALETVILEDVFGKDNQYLKGHEYDLTYSDWDIEYSNGRQIQGFSMVHILPQEFIDKYFKLEEQYVCEGSNGKRYIKVK